MKDLKELESELMNEIIDSSIRVRYRTISRWLEISSEEGIISSVDFRSIYSIVSKYRLNLFIDAFKQNEKIMPRIIIY